MHPNTFIHYILDRYCVYIITSIVLYSQNPYMPVFPTSQSIKKKTTEKNIQRMWWISKTHPKRPGVMFFSPPLTPGLRKAAKKVAEEQPVGSGQFGTFGRKRGFRIRWEGGSRGRMGYHGNPQPSFLGVISPIYWGCKTFIFHGFGVQG